MWCGLHRTRKCVGFFKHKYWNSDDNHNSGFSDDILPTQSNGNGVVAGDRRSSLQKPNTSADWIKSDMVRSSSVGHSLTKANRQHHSQHKVHYDQVDTDTVINGVTHIDGEEMQPAMSHPYLNGNEDRLHFKSSHRSIHKAGTMSRPDILYQGSLYNIPNFKSSHDIRGGDTERYGSFRRVDEDAVSSRTISDLSDCMLVRFRNHIPPVCGVSYYCMLSESDAHRLTHILCICFRYRKKKVKEQSAVAFHLGFL